jgi:hypothetical protein
MRKRMKSINIVKSVPATKSKHVKESDTAVAAPTLSLVSETQAVCSTGGDGMGASTSRAEGSFQEAEM